MKKECIGCNNYFDEHDGSEIFICSKCKAKYTNSEQKRIFDNVCGSLRAEINELLIEAGAQRDDSSGWGQMSCYGSTMSVHVGPRGRRSDSDNIEIQVYFTSCDTNIKIDATDPDYEEKIKLWAKTEFKRCKEQNKQTNEMFDIVASRFSKFSETYKRLLFEKIAKEFGYKIK